MEPMMFASATGKYYFFKNDFKVFFIIFLKMISQSSRYVLCRKVWILCKRKLLSCQYNIASYIPTTAAFLIVLKSKVCLKNFCVYHHIFLIQIDDTMLCTVMEVHSGIIILTDLSRIFLFPTPCYYAVCFTN